MSGRGGREEGGEVGGGGRGGEGRMRCCWKEEDKEEKDEMF